MPRLDPPKEHRFPANRPYAPHTQKHPNGYLTPFLKRLLKKSITVPNPENPKGKLIKLKIRDAIVWRRIMNACEGDDLAIERIFNRLDGKVAETVKIVEQDKTLMDEEIELIPTNGKKIPNRISKFINN